MLDAECREDLRQGSGSRTIDGREQLLRAQLTEALERQQLLDVERVDVARILHQPRVGQLEHRALAEALDVHRAARGEIDDALVALVRAPGFDAPRVGFTLGANESALQRAGTLGRELPRLRPLGAHREHRADHLGNHVTGLAHHHGVAGTNILHANLILVVKSRHADGGTPHEHRFENRERSRTTRATDRHLDVAQQGGSFLGRELEGDGPSRCASGETESLALREIVDLHHHTIDLVADGVSIGLPLLAELHHVVERIDEGDRRVHRESDVAQESQGVVVRREVGTTHHLAQLIRPERETSRRGDRRILLTQTPRTGVARIHRHRFGFATGGEAFEVLGFLGRPQALERLDGQIHLPAHLEHLR